MKVGWLYDRPPFIGGAELTEQELRAAKPDGIQLVDPLPGERLELEDCQAIVIHNCITFCDQIAELADYEIPIYKFWNDVGSWYGDDVHAFLDAQAVPICCSPLQADYMGYDDSLLIPPPIHLDRFYAAARAVNGNRAGAVSIGSWRNRGKGAHNAQAWANGNGGIDFYGPGPFAPAGSREIAYQGIAAILARYQTFVYLPEVIEPFGRCVAEAWAAGCEIITNELVGAAYWIRERPEALATAAEDFWTAVTG